MIYAGQPLDLLQSVYIDQVLPFVYSYIELTGPIDMERLRRAVSATVEVIPQLLCRYDYGRNGWRPAGYDIESIIHVMTDPEADSVVVWDMREGPQLRINIHRYSDHDRLQLCLSHVFADARGLVQYVGLLCRYYNEGNPPYSAAVNYRHIVPEVRRLKAHHIDRGPVLESASAVREVLPHDSAKQRYITLKVNVTAPQMALIKASAKSFGVTLNDAFMASYVHAMKDYTSGQAVALPCPQDLRPFDPVEGRLTVGNVSGRYTCRVPLAPQMSLMDTALAIHDDMVRLKEANASIVHLDALIRAYPFTPKPLMRFFVRSLYSLGSTSYTNIGVVDERQVWFEGVDIVSCHMGSAYRPAPTFQISVSSFRNTCTLAANMLGSERQIETGARLLEDVKSTLLTGFAQPD
jgi:NRPS condensation-like uncharacterized protein